MVGRPCSRVEINLNDMEKTIRDIKVLLKVASNLELEFIHKIRNLKLQNLSPNSSILELISVTQ